MNTNITATEAAITHIRKSIAKRSSGIGLRLHIEMKGCSGYKYDVSYVDAAQPDDQIFPIDETLAIYVEKQVFPFVKGTVIDYIQEGLNARFVYLNPNQTGECGCGESFTVDE